ncbi:MAG: carboxypeptidase regulatory-like domain-containing protein, partial [Bacteroidetes bacterium]|nr:carboxypeptidase regulatory-like domain-containing protein [Bacteroidota bacterium]
MKQVLQWTLVLFLGFASVALAQNSRMILLIEPAASPGSPLAIEAGEVVQFSAKAYEYSSAGMKVEVPITAITWSVDPATFGSITQQGEFTATAHMTNILHGTITATASVGPVTISSSVVARLRSNASYTFSGTVLHGNTAIKDAKVVITSVGMLPFMLDGRTDANGAYSINVPPGSYIVRAQAHGYLPQYFDGVSDPQDAKVFDTDPAQQVIGNIDFNLDTGGSIRGQVTDAATAAPIEHALVYAFEGNNTRPPGNVGQFVARTDVHGAYVIEGLPDGDYLVSANHKDYITQFYDGQETPSTATAVTVSGGAAIDDIDFALNERQPDPVFTFSGSVHAGSTPIPGATISIIHKGRLPYTIDGQTDANGYFSIEVPPGSYIVRAEASGYMTLFFDNAGTAAEAHVFVTDPSQLLIGNIDFNLSKGGSIRGQVTDEAT